MNEKLWELDYRRLAEDIKLWGMELCFQQVGIGSIELDEDEEHLEKWLAADRYGEMEYMVHHGRKRTRPSELIPGTRCIISARMDYLPADGMQAAKKILADPRQAYIARYALGKDYHKLLRRRLARLVQRIREAVGDKDKMLPMRAFTGSGPVLEKGLARNGGLGWIGKNTTLIHRQAGSWSLLGEIYINLPLPTDEPNHRHDKGHCGTCQTCIAACPTGAIVAPWQLDARRCISYLTVEYRGSIPLALRSKMGNRIFGCDDCQLVCPWNRFAKVSKEPGFLPKNGLDGPKLVKLFQWSETEFTTRTAGSPLRRMGYLCWLRNIAVAMGNAPRSTQMIATLERQSAHPSPLVAEHVAWALDRHRGG